jgi:hypothetical protein
VKRGEMKTVPQAAPSLFGAPEYRAARLAADQTEAVRSAYEERAGIMEFDGNVPRTTAERWARASIQRPGAVRGVPTEAVRLLVASGALRRAP